MTDLFLSSILVFMIISALVAIYTDDLLSAVIAVGAVGFGCSMGYVVMAAPDLAITQIVVEVVTLVLLIRATISVGLRLSSRALKKRRLAIAGPLGLLALGVFVLSLRTFPPFGTSVMERIQNVPAIFYLENSLDLTGAANAVTGILLDFRAYDTLGEATVILTAVLGGVVLLRRNGRKRALLPRRDENGGPE